MAQKSVLALSEQDVEKAPLPLLRVLAYLSLQSPAQASLKEAIINAAWKQSWNAYYTIRSDYAFYHIPPSAWHFTLGVGLTATAYTLSALPLAEMICAGGLLLGQSLLKGKISQHDLSWMQWGLGSQLLLRSISWYSGM